MLTKDTLKRSGDWLFRWRSYTPLAVLVLALYESRNFSYLGGSHKIDLLWEVFCLGVGTIGIVIRCIAVGYSPQGTSGRNSRNGQEARRLNTTGLYSLVRNPLYVGNFFLWMGAAMFLHNVWLVVVTMALFLFLYERIVVAEEAFLEATFGDEFRSWADKTPAFIPRLRAGYTPPDLTFSVRNALKREYAGAFGFIGVLFVLEWAGDWFQRGRANPDPYWLVLFAVSALAYVSLRALKKYTRVLHVDGR